MAILLVRHKGHLAERVGVVLAGEVHPGVVLAAVVGAVVVEVHAVVVAGARLARLPRREVHLLARLDPHPLALMAKVEPADPVGGVSVTSLGLKAK